MKTKAVTNKKIYDNHLRYDFATTYKVDSILGVWIINHKFKSKKNNESLEIEGEYEVNIWYSYANNSKTSVEARKIQYSEIVPKIFNKESNWSIKCLGNPSCDKTTIENGIIAVRIFKQFEIEIIDEVEIIENKPEKIEILDIKIQDERTGNSYLVNENGTKCFLTKHSKMIAEKQNEIIKRLNYLLEKSDGNENN